MLIKTLSAQKIEQVGSAETRAGVNHVRAPGSALSGQAGHGASEVLPPNLALLGLQERCSQVPPAVVGSAIHSVRGWGSLLLSLSFVVVGFAFLKGLPVELHV